MKELFSSRTHTLLRRELRNNPTPAERLLWKHLQNKKLLGFKFRRQAGVGRYVADFYCPSAKLVVEVDGDVHSAPSAKSYDAIRDDFAKGAGLKVLRFTNDEVLAQTSWVITSIAQTLIS